jgi:hypothetical protein
MRLSRSLVACASATLLSFPGVACSSSSGSAETGCSGLTACCASLDGADQAACQSAVMMSGASDEACTDALMTLQHQGICAAEASGGDGSGGTDGGGGGRQDSDLPMGCGALSACCPTLPVAEDPMGCLTVAMEGTTEACTESLSTYQTAGYCFSPDGGSLPSCMNPTPEELALDKTCDPCLLTHCGSAVSGIESACSATLSCVSSCACSDSACLEACYSDMSADCQSAITALEPCEEEFCKTACSPATVKPDAGS